MKTIIRSGLGLMLLLMASSIDGQGLLNVAFRPSASVPVQDLGNTALKMGGGFEATVSYQFLRGFTMYGGWGWNTFHPEDDQSFFEHIEETGYRFGVQRIQPLSEDSRLNFLLTAGAIWNHLEAENTDGDIIDDSGHGLGWEADLGIAIPLNQRWQIVPGVRYHALSRDLNTDGVSQPVDLNYISIGVAVSWILVEK